MTSSSVIKSIFILQNLECVWTNLKKKKMTNLLRRSLLGYWITSVKLIFAWCVCFVVFLCFVEFIVLLVVFLGGNPI